MVITHLLLCYHPRFLELDSKWVDALFEAERDIKDESGWSSLMYFFNSNGLDGFDFRSRRFRELLQKQCDWVIMIIQLR